MSEFDQIIADADIDLMRVFGDQGVLITSTGFQRVIGVSIERNVEVTDDYGRVTSRHVVASFRPPEGFDIARGSTLHVGDEQWQLDQLMSSDGSMVQWFLR